MALIHNSHLRWIVSRCSTSSALFLLVKGFVRETRNLPMVALLAKLRSTSTSTSQQQLLFTIVPCRELIQETRKHLTTVSDRRKSLKWTHKLIFIYRLFRQSCVNAEIIFNHDRPPKQRLTLLLFLQQALYDWTRSASTEAISSTTTKRKPKQKQMLVAKFLAPKITKPSGKERSNNALLGIIFP